MISTLMTMEFYSVHTKNFFSSKQLFNFISLQVITFHQMHLRMSHNSSHTKKPPPIIIYYKKYKYLINLFLIMESINYFFKN